MNTLPKINSKSDAMVYAIEKADADVEVASKIYHLFADNMQLPDTEIQTKESFARDTVSQLLSNLMAEKKKQESDMDITVQAI